MGIIQEMFDVSERHQLTGKQRRKDHRQGFQAQLHHHCQSQTSETRRGLHTVERPQFLLPPLSSYFCLFRLPNTNNGIKKGLYYT
jgi:hypothetical protein